MRVAHLENILIHLHQLQKATFGGQASAESYTIGIQTKQLLQLSKTFRYANALKSIDIGNGIDEKLALIV